jgi:hypothetical protein
MMTLLNRMPRSEHPLSVSHPLPQDSTEVRPQKRTGLTVGAGHGFDGRSARAFLDQVPELGHEAGAHTRSR